VTSFRAARRPSFSFPTLARPKPAWAPAVVAIVGTALVWEFVGEHALIAHGALPSLSGIVQQLWADRADYPPHILATVRNAGLGFVIGNAIGMALALLFTILPPLGRVMRNTLVALFCTPLVVIAPVLAVCFSGEVPKVILAALVVFFPTFEITSAGLNRLNGTAVDVFHVYGGGRTQQLARLQVPGALPSVFTALKVAAPGAVLGAMIGDFLGGRYGLGIYMLGSLRSAIPERIWGIGLMTALLGALGYAAFDALGRMALRTRRDNAPTMRGDRAPRMDGRPLAQRVAVVVLRAVASIGVALLLWIGFLRAFSLSPIFAKGPSDVWSFLVSGPTATVNRDALFDALRESAGPALIGVVAGLAAAFVLALLTSLRPALVTAFMPVVFISQTVPLVALTPVIVLVFGRGLSTIIAVAVSVTFFPSFAVITEGLASIPTASRDFMHAYGAGQFQVLRKVSVPYATAHLFTAARLAAPRVFLGVILAENLATGTGLGGLLAEARGSLSYGMLWSLAIAVAVISVLIYQLVSAIADGVEDRLLGARA
jgi:sulfonate transport system permease protein